MPLLHVNTRILVVQNYLFRTPQVITNGISGNTSVYVNTRILFKIAEHSFIPGLPQSR